MGGRLAASAIEVLPDRSTVSAVGIVYEKGEHNMAQAGTQFSRRTFVIGAAGVAAMAAWQGGVRPAWAGEPVETVTPYQNVEEADLVVIGAGGAGLSAAVAAVDMGARRVVVLEGQGRTGGSLNLTSGSMSCAESVIQAEDGIEDSIDAFVADIMATGGAYGGKPSEELVRVFAENDVAMFQWLWDHGLSDYEFSMDAQGRRAVFAPRRARRDRDAVPER